MDAAALDALLRERLAAARVPGAAVGVLRDGGMEYQALIGLRDRERGLPVTPDTIFGLGSVSKLYTGAAFLRRVQRGRLGPGDPARRWLPRLTVPGSARMRLHHLLTHTSGLPPLPGRFHAWDAARPGVFDGGARDVDATALAGPPEARAGFRDAAGLVAWLDAQDVTPLAEPGSLLSYSNEGYVLVGGALEAEAGAPFEEVLERELFAPLGLSHSVVGAAALAGRDDVAHPYRLERGGPDGEEPVRAPHWDAPAWHAPGGVRAGLRDLLQLLAGLAPPLLDEASAARLFAPHARCAASGWGYGYGIALLEHRGHRVALHEGGRDGVAACVARAPDAGVSVAALCNLAGPTATVACLAALNAALGLPLEAPLHVLEELDAEPAGLADAAGCYASPETGRRIEFAREAGRLGVRTPDGRFVPTPAVGRDRVQLAGEPVRFLRRTDGEVWALAAGMRVVPREREGPA